MYLKIVSIIRFICIFTVFLALISSNASALDVKLKDPDQLPSKLNEGDPVNFTIEITDYAETTDPIIIETDLETTDTDLYKFGNPNNIDVKYIGKTVSINTLNSSQQNFIDVTISGKAPKGESYHKQDCGLIIINFNEEQRYYQVHQKLANKVRTFELDIKRKNEFEAKMDKIDENVFASLKMDIISLFTSGLVSQAESLADKLSKVRIPGELTLMGFIKIDSDMKLNFFSLVFVIIGGAIGGAIGFTFGRIEPKR